MWHAIKIRTFSKFYVISFDLLLWFFLPRVSQKFYMYKSYEYVKSLRFFHVIIKVKLYVLGEKEGFNFYLNIL